MGDQRHPVPKAASQPSTIRTLRVFYNTRQEDSADSEQGGADEGDEEQVGQQAGVKPRPR